MVIVMRQRSIMFTQMCFRHSFIESELHPEYGAVFNVMVFAHVHHQLLSVYTFRLIETSDISCTTMSRLSKY